MLTSSTPSSRTLPLVLLLALVVFPPPLRAMEATGAAAVTVVPGLEPATVHTISFPPTLARFVRLVVTGSENGDCCIDELEIRGPDAQENLALSSLGARASASSCLAGYAGHSIAFLNDGRYGNDHSWVCGERTGWAQIELPRSALVASVTWSRDREGRFHDRQLAACDIQLSLDGQAWTTVRSMRALGTEAEEAQRLAMTFDPAALRRAISAMTVRHPGLALPEQVGERLSGYERRLPEVLSGLLEAKDAPAYRQARALGEAMLEFKKRILLSDPAIDFSSAVIIRRHPQAYDKIKHGYHDELGLPVNYCGSSTTNPVGWDNEMAVLDIRDGSSTTLYRPATPAIVADLNLHFDARQLLFASAGTGHRWRIFEMGIDGSGLRQVSTQTRDDVDEYNPVYLPDGRIIHLSSATYAGVPCFGGTDYVANLFIMNADGTGIRRLTFEQDNDWHPTILQNGRVMYLRWEYTDTAHYFSRVLMQMNPDGTGQVAMYGSNSYWPNTMFYPKALPDTPSRVVAIVSGHHGTCRAGEMYLFDRNKGTSETSGVVQRIAPRFSTKPTQGQIKDQLVDASWPKFLFPQPISDEAFLVSCKPTPTGRWGIYLADIHGNLTLLAEDADCALFEPTPIRRRPTPPAIPDKVNLSSSQATVFIQDIYEGPGLRGVPRGTVKNLRLFCYEYCYRDMGGHYRIGMEGPWDVRRILGTVPVHDDGSASFRIPANTPVSIQPLDAEGKALQLMRSWFVGMPGETVSCVGCHEFQTTAVLPRKRTAALSRAPDDIVPWHGPRRGFSFLREVQPVLNKHCVRCHDGSAAELPDFKNLAIVGRDSQLSGFPQSYMALHPFVRRNGPEGDYHLLTPLEFHADTSELVQMLKKGHHGVRLEPEAWDRLVTWIDLNVPCHGTWSESQHIGKNYDQKRREVKALYCNITDDPEAIIVGEAYDQTPVAPVPVDERSVPRPTLAGWPLTGEQARRLQAAAGVRTLEADLGNGQKLTFVRIPAGSFVMGSPDGPADERPMTVQTISKPFWMCATEVTLAQYRAFAPDHRNGYYDQHYKDQVRPGYDMDRDEYPAIRLSWHEAQAFCAWLGKKIGRQASLPDEAQWEYACRAGSATDMSYGASSADFAAYANFADRQLVKMAVIGVDPQPMKNPNKYWDYIPKIASVDDGHMLLAPVGSYQANAWGLLDMHGNVAEWCLDSYRPYPYAAPQAPGDDDGRKVVRGGSWQDRPFRGTSSFRLAYPAWQKVYHVGFRPVILDGGMVTAQYRSPR